MYRFHRFLAATFVSAAMLCTSAAQAMEIWQYDKMANADQGEYIADLVIGAQKVLRDDGKPNLADQVHKLFTTINPGDKIPLGIAEFELNLALARVTDAKNVVKDPNTPRIEVEDAMAVTLQKNGIEVPDSFFTVASSFRPKFPPR